MSYQPVANDGQSTSTAPKPANATNAQSQVKFLGPGQEEFGSFLEQANAFLDLYLPDWRTSGKYLLPHAFDFQHADVCDEAMAKAPGTSEAGHRQGDEAEYLMYKAIFELLKLIKAPVIAFRGLKMINVKGIHKWNAIFPTLNQSEFEHALREYDFVLIGPTIGIVVIEIKGCEFNPKREFMKGYKRVPHQYSKGLEQSKSIFTLLNLLKTYTGVAISQSCIRRILFAPNLETERYDNWYRSLNKSDQSRVRQYVGEIIQIHGIKDSSSLARKLEGIFENCSQIIMRDGYEVYVPVLAGISALLMLQSDCGIPSCINLDDTNFSMRDTVTKIHDQLSTQNPSQGHPHNLSSLVEASETLEKHIKVLFLSPDQQEALNGPNLQFIIGVAGTGKTVILQAKALELLAKGDKVTVMAPESYVDHYKELFYTNGYESSQFHLLSDYDDLYEMAEIIEDAGVVTDRPYLYLDQCRLVYEYLNNLQSVPKVLQWLHTSNHIIIDDLLDLPIAPIYRFDWVSFCVAYLAMIFANDTKLEKVVWIASDPSYWHDLNTFITDFYQDTINKPKLVNLKQVMRCSENIFNAAMYQNASGIDSNTMPVIGHKIKGCEVVTEISRISGKFGINDEALSSLCDSIQQQLDSLIKEGFSLDSIAIIVMDPEDNKRLEDNYRYKEHLQDFFGRTGRPYSNKKEKGMLTIQRWDCVSSLEWAVIIYTANSRLDENKFEYTRYRAATRATSKLIQIKIGYSDD